MGKNSRAKSGLTLIEILIALLVMIIGLVGVLAVFPVAIQSTNESVEERMAAAVAESVAHALTVAMRSATPEDSATATQAIVTLHHDGLSEQGKTYQFKLPLPEPTNLPEAPNKPGFFKPRFFGHPDGTTSAPTDVFMLGSESYLSTVFKDVISGPDKTDPYTQYGFTFTVCRVDDARPKTQTDTTEATTTTDDDYTPIPLYEFRIAVYRIGSTSSGGYYTVGLPKPLKVFVIQLAGQ